jgi:peptidyl-prolyl cis-trans isomerase D
MMLLRSMRKGFLSAIFLGLLVLGAVGLIFSDWHGMFQNGYSRTDVAIVDGTPLKISEFNSRVTHILRQQQISPDEAYQTGLINSLLTGEIFNILLKKEAERLGIRVDDRLIAKQIKTFITPYKSDKTTDQEALKKFLEIQGLSEKKLVTALRDDLTSKILKSSFSTGFYLPDAFISDIHAYRGMKKDVDVVFIPNASIKLKAHPTDADLETYYIQKSTAFMNPETRDITVAILDTSKISKPEVSDSEIQASFDENKDKFEVAASAELEQSVVDTEEKAALIAELLKSGKSMPDAVKKVTGKTDAAQEKNVFSKDALPSQISTPVFLGKSGDVIGPIKTPLGYHVIRLIALKDAHTAPFESVKDKIRKDLQDEKLGNAVYDVTSAIEDRLANGESYESIAKDYPLTVTSFKSLEQTSKPAKTQLFSDKEFETILVKAYSLKDTTSTEMADFSSNKLYSVRVDKISAAMPKPFKTVKSDILKQWASDHQSQENLISAQKRVEDLISGKIQFKSLSPMTIRGLSHAGATSLPKDVIERFMLAEKGEFILAFSRDKDGLYIGRVTSVMLPQNVKSDPSLRQSIESVFSDSSYMGYMDFLQTKYPVKINEALLARTYGKAENDAP